MPAPDPGAALFSPVNGAVPCETLTTPAEPPSAAGARSARLSRPVRLMVGYIEENYAETIRLDELGRRCNRTIFQIIRAFRRELGTTPHAFLLRIRIDRAAALLAAGDSVAEAAAATGFADQSHFGRHFKRRFGATPREFVRHARPAPPARAG